MKEIKCYTCDHCGKIYKRKSGALKHEIICCKNPQNKRACFGCKYLQKSKAVIWYDSPMGGDYTCEYSVLKCMKKDEFVYPPAVEYKGNALPIEEGNCPMPLTCELREEPSCIDEIPTIYY